MAARQAPLKSAQVRRLRGLCHDLNPVVTVADKGLTDNVMAELELALDHHELIKVKLRGERAQRAEWIEAIAEKTGAVVVQKIGQVACYFRRNPDNPRISLA